MLVFLLSAALLNCAKESKPDVAYMVSPLFENSAPKLLVQMRFAADSSGKTILEFNDQVWGEKNLHDVVESTKLLNAIGEIEQNRDSGWFLIKHPKDLDSIRFEYVLKQDFDHPISTREVYRPIIQPAYFHVFSHNLFMVPKMEKDTVDISISWRGFSEKDVIHNSFGSQQREQLLENVLWEEFGNAIFVGGDFRVHKDEIKGNAISLATRGEWIPFQEDSVMHVLKQTLQCQRDFWNDHSQEYFTVTMQPFPQENGSSFQGTGLTNSFATSISNNEFADIEQLVYLFNHELMHNWIGHTIKNDNEEEQYWFSEGFTEYYAFKNIAKNNINGLGASYFIDSMNKTIRNLFSSPVFEAPNSEINYDNFWGNREYSKLPYYRGALFAFILDQKIQKQTDNRQSLDDVMRQILKDATKKGQKLTHDYFLQVMGKYLGKDFNTFFEIHIVQGRPLPLADFFDELGLDFERETQLFEMGFELSDDRKEVVSVIKGSNAEKAGLIAGDRLYSRSIHYGNVAKPIELGVLRNGNEIDISFYPVKTALVPTLLNSPKNQSLLMP
ncbi:M1 family aminopeptidase [Flagellimonas lutaonensis]|nr:M1 family aminopeptidase [Allomuricauda lutaonensis]